jgi:protein lifeguard
MTAISWCHEKKEHIASQKMSVHQAQPIPIAEAVPKRTTPAGSGPLYTTVDLESYGAISEEDQIAIRAAAAPSPTVATSREGKTKHEMFGHTSHFWLEEHESFQGDHDANLQSIFIQKVYSILSFQLLLTLFVCMMFMYIDTLRILAIRHSFAFTVVSAIGSIGSLIGLMFYKDQYPMNIHLLSLFTLCESLLVGVICAMYQQVGYGDLIVQAFAITTMVFILLTYFAASTHVDFTPYMGLFVALLISMMVWSFFCMLFGVSTGAIYAWVGVLVFSGFIVIDTQMIIYKFGYDDYIVASIELYLDIINMFLYILRILTSSRDD